MKNIILASASPQRKNLLNLLGIPYTIRPSHSNELKKITTTCSQFVKDNALLKARDVAGQMKDGVVIGADTIVYVGGKKIIGKPKDLKQAKEHLKLLMSRPHWVYTGVAVIDVKANKEIVDHVKTKIFMTKISDEAIDEYYKHMSPLDKAGGFDIEGKGSVLSGVLKAVTLMSSGFLWRSCARCLRRWVSIFLRFVLCFPCRVAAANIIWRHKNRRRFFMVRSAKKASGRPWRRASTKS